MLRHEDRLYHIVVSFPSICAKQFLIFKFRRNEAIYCLIGFGIGIGCCLMYRWFRNTFFSLNYISAKTNFECYDLNPYLNVNTNAEASMNIRKKHKTSITDTTNNFRKSKSPKTKRFDKNSDDIFANNDDIYQNLAKFLNKQLCKNFKFRRPNRKQYTRKKFNLFEKSNSLSPIQSDLQTPKTYDSHTLTSSSESTHTCKNDTDKNNNLSEDSLYSNIFDKVNKSRRNSYSIFNDSICGDNRTESVFNLSNNNLYDDDSLELFANTSHRSSNIEVDFISGVPMKKSINSVDKSLDEALKHINKLKEDMNHLCSDIDHLYHSKPKVEATISNESFASSCSNLHFENDEDLAEDFTSLNENSRFTTPFKELHTAKYKKPDDNYLIEKCTQTEKRKSKPFKRRQHKKRKINKYSKRYKSECH